MVDLSISLDPGSFDGGQLLWDVPLVMSPLTGEGPQFESRNISLGVEGVLLNKPTATSRGFNLVQEGNVIQIRVPFGAKGGYRKVKSTQFKPWTWPSNATCRYEQIFSFFCRAWW